MGTAIHHDSCNPEKKVTTCSRTVLFWGAGATASLGLRMTAQQAQFLRALAPDYRKSETDSVHTRVRNALGEDVPNRWIVAFSDLLRILGDRGVANGHELSIADINVKELDAMACNWTCNDEGQRRNRIVELRSLYDWPALVAAINVCPHSAPQSGSRSAAAAEDTCFELTDLFNLLDMHHRSGHGFPDRDGSFLTPQRVLGARGALGLLIQSLFYVDWHIHARTHADLKHHYDFAVEMARRMQSQGLRFAETADPDDFEDLKFILGDVSVVSMNWDPIGLWAQFVANGDLNRAANVPNVDSPACRIQLYHDVGYFVAGPRVGKDHAGSKVWQPMNISGARQLNDRDHGAGVRIRVSKYLFPHGCLWWRECPNCGKLSSYIGDVWEIDSESLLPPPPLMAFADNDQFKSWMPNEGRERDEWKIGRVDARACVHCKTLTYAHHTPLVGQTGFKTAPPPFLEEIQREMRVVVQKANHVIFMGYSLPPDDITYRAFLAARVSKDPKSQVRCSVVDKEDGYESRWLYPEELQTRGTLPETVTRACELFETKNVRFFGAGVPDVLLDGGAAVTAHAVDRLLTWNRRS